MVANLLKDPKTWYAIVTFLFGGLVTGPVGNRIWDWPTVWPWTLIALICAIIVALWRRSEAQTQQCIADGIRALQERDQQREAYRSQFALCKPVLDLRPADFGFQFLDPGEESDRDRRPFYQRYVPRRIVPLESIGSLHHSRTFTESSLVDELEAGGRVVILGQPTMGKSRTLYEVVKSLRDWVVIRPSADRPPPSTEALETFVADQHVVLILEDLNDFASGAAPDLVALRDAIRKTRPKRLAIAATCRDGSELSVVSEAVDSSLRRFYDDIPLKVLLLPQTSEEKGEVAASSGRTDWDPDNADRYPTPGAIVMEEALRYQRSRFEVLSGDQQDALRSLQLLTAAGVLPHTHGRLLVVMKHVFERVPLHLGEVLDRLAEESFLRRPARQDPLAPEPAYVGFPVVSYIDGRHPRDDFPNLKDALRAGDDDVGLNLFGATLAVDQKDYAAALAAFEAALELRADSSDALYNKGIALALLGRDTEALEAHEAALELRPDHPDTHNNRGVAFASLGRYAEALKAYDAALELRPNHPDTLHNKGVALATLGQYAEALKAYEAALALQPDDSATLRNKGVALARLGRYAEALKAYEASLELQPDDPGALQDRGVALAKLGRRTEALEAYQAALRINPNDPQALHNMGITLFNLGRYAEAVKAFEAALIF